MTQFYSFSLTKRHQPSGKNINDLILKLTHRCLLFWIVESYLMRMNYIVNKKVFPFYNREIKSTKQFYILFDLSNLCLDFFISFLLTWKNAKTIFNQKIQESLVFNPFWQKWKRIYVKFTTEVLAENNYNFRQS